MIEVKRNIKDSIFTAMFKDRKYLIQLYQSLHPEDNIIDDDLRIITIENILTNDIYNDLGFIVKNKLIILVEAQTTWSPNIIIRMFIYLAKTYQEYIFSNKEQLIRLYSPSKIELPTPELYVIYTGEQENKSNSISLKEEFFANSSSLIDLKANIIYADKDRNDIIGQYISFCVILKEQIRMNKGDKKKAVRETIRICIEEGNLEDYLSKHQKEVEDYMFALLTEEELYSAAIDYTKLNSLEILIHNLKELLPSFEEVYKKVSTQELYSGFSKDVIREIYEKN